MRILISPCLLGCRCRYDGASKTQPWVAALAERYELVPVCPEQLGGLATPRPPAERRGGRRGAPAGGGGGTPPPPRTCAILSMSTSGSELPLARIESPGTGSGPKMKKW